MTKKYCKLVRDGIPDIIRSQGKHCVTRVLSDAEYTAKLNEKLTEELGEYLQSGEPEELADLLEVIAAVAVNQGMDYSQLNRLRDEKRRLRGGFQKRILLLEVSDDLEKG